MGLRPSLYKMRGGGSSLQDTIWHNFSRCPVDPFLEFVAWRSPARRILHHHHAVVLLEFLQGSSTSVASVDRGKEVVIKPYV